MPFGIERKILEGKERFERGATTVASEAREKFQQEFIRGRISLPPPLPRRSP